MARKWAAERPDAPVEKDEPRVGRTLLDQMMLDSVHNVEVLAAIMCSRLDHLAASRDHRAILRQNDPIFVEVASIRRNLDAFERYFLTAEDLLAEERRMERENQD